MENDPLLEWAEWLDGHPFHIATTSMADELRKRIPAHDAQVRLELLRDLKYHVERLSEWYEWMKGPGSCYPSPKQSMILRHQILDWIDGQLEREAGLRPVAATGDEKGVKS